MRKMEGVTEESKESLKSFEEILSDGIPLYEKEEVQEENHPFIIFRLSQDYYGIEISKIKEILKKPKITPLPFGPRFISGVTHFRGNILSVTDLKRILGLPREEGREETKLIVVESRSMETGILVDEVVDSAEIPANQIPPFSHPLQEEMEGVLEGICKWKERWVGLINIDKVLEKGSERRDEDPTIRNIERPEEIF